MRALILFTCAASIALAIATTHARADEGMWLFNKPPKKQVKDRYGFDITQEWLDHVQKSCVRISTGGSGSIVSPTGLVMTNHHVGSDMLEKLSTADRDYIQQGFHAKTLAEEKKCPEIEMVILWSVEDVTDRVKDAATSGMSSAEASTARRAMMSTIEKESLDATGLKSDVVTLWQGGRYHLYRYKRYTDVRLVFAPEKGIASFGGDTDNFEYPRFSLDMLFFRIWENDKPLVAEHYLKWSRNGSADGDLVFVAGHPGGTQRLNTLDHIKYLRDVQYPLSMRSLWRREVQLATFAGRSEENKRIAGGDYASVTNTRKNFTGRIAGLQDPEFIARKAAEEKKLKAAVAANPEWQKQWGDAWDQIGRAMKVNAEIRPRFVAMGGTNLALGGTLFAKARDLVRNADEAGKPNAQRLREYRETNKATLELGLFSPAPIYEDFEVENLWASFQQMGELLGCEDPIYVKAMAGKSPRARAEECVRGTKLADVAERKRLYEGGKAAIDASTDPMILLVKSLDADSRALRKRYEDEVDAQEKEGYAKISAANFAVNGENQYPDATFTLRLSYGTVKGYPESGMDIPPFTNFAGLFRRSEERGDEEPFELPAKWKEAREKLNMNTPYNFVSTCDIIGGNSGSPVISTAGEVVGLVFDGNLQSLVGNFGYEETYNRTVSVDSRSMIESLRKVYDAGTLADEITGPSSASGGAGGK
jgi:hypothetical protein